MRKILITGGAGFIGCNLTKRLLNDGETIIVVDNLITSSKNNIKDLLGNPRFKFLKRDIVRPFPEKIKESLVGVNEIYHLACPTGVENLGKLSEEMLLTCSYGTRNVLEIARKFHARVLFTSSSEVYGEPKEFPQKENYTGNVDPVGYRSPYEEGKRFSESLVTMYVHKYNIDARIVRVFNTYGPGMSLSDSRVVSRFIKNVLENKPLEVMGDGLQTRTLCFVTDMVEGLILAMEKGKRGEVYNIGSKKEISIKDLANSVISISNSKSKIKFVPRPLHDHNRRLPDVTKIEKLSWKPKVNLSEGIKKTLL